MEKNTTESKNNEPIGKGKTAIITGGSRGIGEAMVLKLGELGFNVVINYRSDSSKTLSEELAKKIEKNYGVQTLIVKADVGKYENCEEIIKQAVNKFGDKIHLLINNAGIAHDYNWIDIKREQYENLINTNLMSFLHMTHLVLPYMINHSSKENQCNIINISSVAGMTGVINQADYCASKSGIIGLSRALALEFGGRGVRVNVIAPGTIMTDMLRSVNQEQLKSIINFVPQGYIGDVSDISGAMEYIIKANYLTGQVISPNGGFVLQ